MWPTFIDLEEEMKAFQPRTLESYHDLYMTEVSRIAALDPKRGQSAIEHLVNERIKFQAQPNWQFQEAYDDRIMGQYVTVVMLSHALCEALINAILAVGLAKTKSTELFAVLDKVDFKQKWLTAPKVLDSTYEFPKGIAMYESLVKLTKQRNALVHHKVQLHVDGVKAFNGSGFERLPYDKECSWLRRFFSLPYDLADFSRAKLKGNFHVILFDRHPIEKAIEHKRISS